MDKTLRAVPGALGRKRAFIFLLNYVPLLHTAAVVAAPIVLGNQGLRIWLPTALLLLYVVPPVLARLLLRLFPVRARVVRLDSRDFVLWWALSSLQIVFDRFSFLEELLRLIPTVYSNWLRLWGSRIGRLTFWSPGVRILDRTHLRIGNDVVLGAGVVLAPHIVAQTPTGELALLFDPIRIGDGVVVGGFATLAPGTVIEDGETTRALLKSPPFSRWKDGRRTKTSVEGWSS